MFPGLPGPVFWLKSGFPKTSFLKSTNDQKFFADNFFPDQNCPGFGFSLNCPVFRIFFNLPFRYSHIIPFKSGVLKLHTCIFLIYFRYLKSYFGNQIWKFMCRYFSKFSGLFFQNLIFSYFGFSFALKLYFR